MMSQPILKHRFIIYFFHYNTRIIFSFMKPSSFYMIEFNVGKCTVIKPNKA